MKKADTAAIEAKDQFDRDRQKKANKASDDDARAAQGRVRCEQQGSGESDSGQPSATTDDAGREGSRDGVRVMWW